jgi:hypothetical protein
MSTRAVMIGILTLSTLAFATNSASADPLRQFCKSAGWKYSPPNASGVSLCVSQDRWDGWVCGGALPGHPNCERIYPAAARG